MSGLDHGMLNLPLNHRARGKSIDREIDDALATIAAVAKRRREVERVERLAKREAEALRPKFTADGLAGAVLVRDQFGWHKVARINAKSVSVETPYSWTDLIPLDKIQEYRA